MGPNEGKTFLEQTKCVARALTAFVPTYFGSDFILGEKRSKYEIEHKTSLQGEWIKMVRPSGDWYICVTSDWSGKSRRTLPEGEKIAATFHCDEDEANRILRLFKEAVTLLDKNVVLSEFWGNIDVSKIISEEREENIDRESVENLKRTVSAIHPDFNKNQIIEFRSWLHRLTHTQEVKQIELSKYPSNVNHYLAVLPKHLVAFSTHLSEERTKHCVDGYLFGSVATTIDICGHIAPKAALEHRIQGVSHNTSIYTNFSSLAIYLTSSEIVNPGTILGATTKRAINSGYGRELIEIVDKYQDIVTQKISEAIDAKSTDDALNLFYDAIPYAFGALTICLNLRSNPKKIDVKTLKIANGKYNQLEENLARLRDPFLHQITDLNGLRWRRKKGIISHYKKKGEEDKIEKYITYWTQEALLYPKSVINGLLSED